MTTELDQAVKTQTLASVLAFDIQEKRKQSLRKKISAYPRATSILSDIGECDRQMVYSITNWKDKPLHDEELQARFNAGNLQEREMYSELQSLGFDLQAGQEVVEIKNRAGETIARGKIDGKIRYQNIKVPFEIKSMNPMVYDNVDDIEDFKKKPYLRKYLRQIQMYLFGNNCEEGLLFCTDCLGHWKIFVITLMVVVKQKPLSSGLSAYTKRLKRMCFQSVSNTATRSAANARSLISAYQTFCVKS